MRSFGSIGEIHKFNKTHSIPKVWRWARIFALAIHQDVRERWLGRYFPSKPSLLQLLMNDVCNSRCTMCNIWQRELEHEISLTVLQSIFAEPLFRAVRQVEISVDEPTLRSDLPEFGQVLVKSLPKLAGVKITTHGLQPSTVVERITALAQVMRQAAIPLSVCVSLDGAGRDYDRNLVAEGSFLSATEVLKPLKQAGLVISVRCILTPVNCYEADDVLLWCEQNEIRDVAFQLGIEVARFYNHGYSQQNPFSLEQRFHLVMFFDKLWRQRGLDPARRAFYRSLVDQLAFGFPRRATCDWQSRRVTVDMRGDLSYCSVQSPIVGSVVEQSARHTFIDGSFDRKRIMREHCYTGQYDHYGSPSVDELAQQVKGVIQTVYQKRRNAIAEAVSQPQPCRPADHDVPREWKQVLITGWYGTETTGDKAILAEVLHFLKTYSPSCKVILTTIDRKVSQQTECELVELHDSVLVDIAKGHDPALIEKVDAVIMGGGPLMETQQMESIWRIFAEANRQRKARIIFGCGVGPLHTERMRQITADVIRMATAGFLRDLESYDAAAKLAPGNPLDYACDPALAYLSRWKTNHVHPICSEGTPLQIAALLRANTREFIADANKAELRDSNTKAAQSIAHALETVCNIYPARASLLAMNTHWLGGDDRVFNREVASFFEFAELVRVEREYFPLEAVMHHLLGADSGVAMRYHGHLFCIALGIPFLSLDYTGRAGKVSSLMRRIGYEQWSDEWGAIDADHTAHRFCQLLDESAYWSAYLQQQAEKLCAELAATYARVFKFQ